MGYDGSGGYNRTRNFSADSSAGIKILASAMDAEFNDFASAMTLPILKDGQNAPTANMPMGGFRHTNVGGPTSASNYIRASDVISNIPIYMIDAETSTDRISVSASYFTTASAGAAPSGGTGILIKMGSNKGSAPALYLNTGGGSPYSANVIMNNGSALWSGAIYSGGIYEFVFASAASVWHLMNPTVHAANTDTQGVIEIATTAEAQAGTDTTRAITPATLANKFSADYATTTSAGLIEIATTAEATAGTNISAAITPATLHVVVSTLSSDLQSSINTLSSADPFVAIFTVASTSVSNVFLSRNSKSSALTITSGGAASWRLGYGEDISSVNAMAINIGILRPNSSVDVYARVQSVDISGFVFHMRKISADVFDSTTNIHLVMHRIF